MTQAHTHTLSLSLAHSHTPSRAHIHTLSHTHTDLAKLLLAGGVKPAHNQGADEPKTAQPTT